jgi:hypothetical protein
MAQAGTPRCYVAQPGLPGAGLPHDRLARLAARQAFVDLKRDFLQAVDRIGDPRSGWLRAQVRAAETPEDLLMLRGPVFECLAGSDEPHRSERHALRRSLDSVFPDSAPRTAFSAF